MGIGGPKGGGKISQQYQGLLLVPILSLFLGPILHILTHFLLIFSVFCTMQLPLQALGMTKLRFMSILFIIIILWFQWLKLA